MPRVNKAVPNLDLDVASPFMEAYRTLKANIEFAARRKDIRAVAVASAGPGEGKSTTALYLAATYARARKSVVLVDADTRKPTLHMALERRRGPGLTDYMLDPSLELRDIAYDTIIGASFIGAGTSVPNPSDLLSSDRADELFTQLRRTYDIVIVDTPPLLAAVDAKIAAAKCDGVLLVMESGKMKEATAKKVRSELDQANAVLLGAVLNKLPRKALGSYLAYGT